MPLNRKVAILTATGDRPVSFSLLERWIIQQKRKPDQWVIIDDGQAPIMPTIPAIYIRRIPQPDDPKCTLALNIKTAIPFLQDADIILFFEDDEYYAPAYIERMIMLLECSIIAGFSHARYYHLPTGGYYQNHNDRHASLAETAIRACALPQLLEIVSASDKPFIDIELWKRLGHAGKLFRDEPDPLFVGMKGMPGRPGAGGGHSLNLYRGRSDASGDVLCSWIPRDYSIYEKIKEGLSHDA